MDINHLLVQTATKVSTTYDKYGDIVYGARTTTRCLYRDISNLNQSTSNRYEVDIVGILWFDADENVSKGDIYLLDDGEYYQIDKILLAKTRVTDNSLKFIKCSVSHARQVS